MTISTSIKYLNLSQAERFLAIAVFCTIAAVYYLWSWSEVLAHFGGDNATYLLTANSFSPFSPRSAVADYFAGISQYPPLYPLLLGLTGGGESILVAHIVTTTFLLAAFVVMYRWLLLLEFGELHALAMIFSISIVPGIYIQALSIHSENLFLLFSLSALLYATKYDKDRDINGLFFAASFIALASLTRTAGIALIIAFVFYLFSNRFQKRYFLSFITVVPMLLWEYFRAEESGSYTEALSGYYSADFAGALLAQLSTQAKFLSEAWFATFTYGIFGHLLLSLLALICLLAMLRRVYMKKLDGIYMLFYLLIVILWPYPAESIRLLCPVIPVLLIQASLLLMNPIQFPGYKSSMPVGNIIMLGALFIIMLPNLVLTVNRFNSKASMELAPYRHTYSWYFLNPERAMDEAKLHHVIITSLQDLKAHVAEDQCIYSIKPSVVGLYMQRRGRPMPGPAVSDGDFFRILRESDCDYFYLMSIRSPSYGEPLYPIKRLANNLDILSVYYLDPQRRENPIAILGKLRGM